MKIPYQLVSMAAILRDYVDMSNWYKDDQHEKLVDIADSLYNVGIKPEDFLDEYKELYDQYGKDFWKLVLKDMSAIDGQLTTDEKVQELIDDYADRYNNITASTAVTAADYSYAHNLIKIAWKDAKFVLSNLNKSHKTVGMGGAGDPGYYVSEFEEATPGYMWASDKGLKILDENGISYELIKKATDDVKAYTYIPSGSFSKSKDVTREVREYCEAHPEFADLGNEIAGKDVWIKLYPDDFEFELSYNGLKSDYYLDHIDDLVVVMRELYPESWYDFGDVEACSINSSNNPFYDKLSDRDKKFVRNTEKKMATEFSPNTFDVYNALLPYIGDYSSNTGWIGSCDLMKVEDDNTADGYRYNVIWDDGHDIDVFSWQINTNSRVGGDFTLMVMPAHGMPDFCDSENDFYRAIRKVFGNGLKKIDN